MPLKILITARVIFPTESGITAEVSISSAVVASGSGRSAPGRCIHQPDLTKYRQRILRVIAIRDVLNAILKHQELPAAWVAADTSFQGRSRAAGAIARGGRCAPGAAADG